MNSIRAILSDPEVLKLITNLTPVRFPMVWRKRRVRSFQYLPHYQRTSCNNQPVDRRALRDDFCYHFNSFSVYENFAYSWFVVCITSTNPWLANMAKNWFS